MDEDIAMSSVAEPGVLQSAGMTQQQEAGAAQERVKQNWDHLYHVDAAVLEKVRKAKPWAAGAGTVHPKYFSRVFCSASATVKMVSQQFAPPIT